MSRSCFGKNVPNFYRQSDLDPEKWTTYVSLVVSYQEVDVPKQFSAELRRDVSARLLAGESVRSLAEELSISRATIYKWKHQALIDAGKRPGTKSFEVDTLAQARRTIRDLEAELALVKAASDLFNANEPISPKASSRLPEG
jgi:transposase-like protein